VGARWRGFVDRARGRAAAADAERALREALVCVLDGDLEGAEERLQRVVRSDSKEVEAYLALARVFRRRGEIGRAIRVHQNVLLRRDVGAAQRAAALRGLADDFRQGGFVERAASAYEELLAERPRDAEALRALVALRRAARQPERALPLVRRLHRLEGAGSGSEGLGRAEAELHVQVAEAARARGRAGEARAALRRALRRDRRCAAAWALRGELEVERGRSRRALAAWRRALELDRRLAPALHPKLRSAFAALGRARGYEELLRARLAAEPGDAGAQLELARLLAERGEVEPALAALRELVERDPDRLEARAEIGRLLASAGRADDACAAYAALAERLAESGAFRAAERGVE
jgi:lipopolysaccharide biosynthesis regulator YciM